MIQYPLLPQINQTGPLIFREFIHELRKNQYRIKTPSLILVLTHFFLFHFLWFRQMFELTLPLRKKRTADQSEVCLFGYVSANEEDENERRSTN